MALSLQLLMAPIDNYFSVPLLLPPPRFKTKIFSLDMAKPPNQSPCFHHPCSPLQALFNKAARQNYLKGSRSCHSSALNPPLVSNLTRS